MNEPAMAGFRSTILLALPFLFISLLLRQTPFMMSEAPLHPEQPWADDPIKLITTPQYETKKTGIFTAGSTHMALLHNTLLRGFNSIYQQALAVQDADKADFIGYALTWHKFFMSHHDDEEAVLFKKIEELLADKDVFAEAYGEHELIEGGMAEFQNYLADMVTAPAAMSGAELVRIMDSFREPFEHHMHHEIALIAQLASHPKAPGQGTPQQAEVAAMFKGWGKATVTKAGTLDVVPFFLLHLDRSAEGGMWANWPPMPVPVRWMLTNVAGAWHGGWWKFSACDAKGKPQALWALRGGRA